MRQNEDLQAEIAAHLETSTKVRKTPIQYTWPYPLLLENMGARIFEPLLQLKEARELKKSAALQAMYEKGFAARLVQEVIYRDGNFKLIS